MPFLGFCQFVPAVSQDIFYGTNISSGGTETRAGSAVIEHNGFPFFVAVNDGDPGASKFYWDNGNGIQSSVNLPNIHINSPSHPLLFDFDPDVVLVKNNGLIYAYIIRLGIINNNQAVFLTSARWNSSLNSFENFTPNTMISASGVTANYPNIDDDGSGRLACTWEAGGQIIVRIFNVTSTQNFYASAGVPFNVSTAIAMNNHYIQMGYNNYSPFVNTKFNEPDICINQNGNVNVAMSYGLGNDDKVRFVAVYSAMFNQLASGTVFSTVTYNEWSPAICPVYRLRPKIASANNISGFDWGLVFFNLDNKCKYNSIGELNLIIKNGGSYYSPILQGQPNSIVCFTNDDGTTCYRATNQNLTNCLSIAATSMYYQIVWEHFGATGNKVYSKKYNFLAQPVQVDNLISIVPYNSTISASVGSISSVQNNLSFQRFAFNFIDNTNLRIGYKTVNHANIALRNIRAADSSHIFSFKSSTLRIYPNPLGYGNYLLDISDNKKIELINSTYTLFDLSGRELYRGVIKKFQTKVQIPILPAGRYLFTVQNQYHKFTEQLIVQ